ncbi:FAD-binding domain-containing protein [Cucurbitaria berberidis CBS 394.84]|uniref:FAD-binding domain-containing protein n=1 Tax=Cucurbitaria berberidis CBS 394.84 TaxID=1168544 RepID=A0A9P4GB70_9PLEO|nr:FAD-binding domain-containing protein [Cucurbitaria berberidis CBS 394.84]KAF1842341.1 FAD-binding domain-containing protein [Cucurbitaria berberidis CBS 394.84]
MPSYNAAFYASTIFAYLIHSVAANTCSQVGALGLNIKRSPSIEYLTEQNNYWSTGCGALKPACILYPKTANEVSAIVQVLHDNNETFAVKSGGHNPNEGFASIQGGPLISTKELNEVTFDSTSMTVRVGPGNDWEDIHKALQDTGVTVVGGRIGEVGVGGYVVGGGLSFLSAEYGWAANNVVEFEVVLANATVVTASSKSHPDLYKALKGGGNNYGIVTAYTMVAHPIGQIWGGNLMFSGDKAPQMLAAVRNFTENYPDEKAGIIMTAELTALGAVDIWIMFLFYDGPTPPPGVFDMFTNIGPIVNNCKTRSYYDLLKYNDFAVVKGSIYTITTETVPLPSFENGAEVMGAIYNNWRNTTKGILGVAGVIGSIAFQPIPKRLARKARELGGDLIDLDDDVDRIVIEFNYSYLFDIDDKTVDQATQQLYKGTRNLVTGFQQSGKLPDAYLPLFMNDWCESYFRQDYFARLRTADFARGVRDQYDPSGFFRDRTKGWKL